MTQRRFNQFRPARKVAAALPANPMVEITIDGMAHDGRGVGRQDNKVVFVKNALPGERVEARLLVRKKQYDEAVAESWLVQSEQRQEPFCPHYSQCGGCQLQHMQLDAQRAFKDKRLQDIVAPHCADNVAAEALLVGDGQDYRHRARLSYRAGHLGFKAAASHQIVEIDRCPVLMPALNEALAASREAVLKYLRRVGNAELLLAAGEGGKVAMRIQQQRGINPAHCQQLVDDLAGAVALHSVSGGDGQWFGDQSPLHYPGRGDLPLVFFRRILPRPTRR